MYSKPKYQLQQTPVVTELQQNLRTWNQVQHELHTLQQKLLPLQNAIKQLETQSKSLETSIIDKLSSQNSLHRHIIIGKNEYRIAERSQYESLTKSNLLQLLQQYFHQDTRIAQDCFDNVWNNRPKNTTHRIVPVKKSVTFASDPFSS